MNALLTTTPADNDDAIDDDDGDAPTTREGQAEEVCWSVKKQ